MNRRLGLLLGIFLSLSICVNGWSQGRPKDKPKLPSPPALSPVPAFAKWLVSYSYPEDKPANGKGPTPRPLNPQLPRSILTTKTGKIFHEETTSVSGKKLDRWQQDQTFYIKNESQRNWGAYDNEYRRKNPTTDPSLSPIPESEFRGLDWIKDDTYAGPVRSGTATFFVFVPSNAAALDVNDAKALEGQPVIAYVDAATRLPASVRENGVTRIYSYSTPPSVPLTIPEDLAASIKRGEELKAKFNAAPQKEY